MTTFKPLEHVLIREDVGTKVTNARFIGQNKTLYKFQVLTVRLIPMKNIMFIVVRESEIKQKIIKL